MSIEDNNLRSFQEVGINTEDKTITREVVKVTEDIGGAQTTFGH